jgi:hypothetical protein
MLAFDAGTPSLMLGRGTLSTPSEGLMQYTTEQNRTHKQKPFQVDEDKLNRVDNGLS